MGGIHSIEMASSKAGDQPGRRDTREGDEFSGHAIIAKGWMVFRCPECASPIKVRKGSDAVSVLCPACKAELDLELGAGDENQEAPDTRGADVPETAAPQPRPPQKERTEVEVPSPAPVQIVESAMDDARLPPEKRRLRPPDPAHIKPVEGFSRLSDRPDLQKKLERKRVHHDSEDSHRGDDWERGSRKESRQELDTKEEKSRLKLAGYVMIVASLLAVAVIAITSMVVSPKFSGRTSTAAGGGHGKDPGGMETSLPGRGASAGQSAAVLSETELRDKARGVAEKFLAAEDWRERAALVRDKDRVLPLMYDYYRAHPDGAVQYDSLRYAGSTSNGSAVTFEVGGSSGAKAFIHVLFTEGEGVVDWECFVAYSQIPLKELVKQRPTTPTLCRILASTDDYYNYEFTDEEALACYRIQDLSGDLSLFGYVRRDNPTKQKLDNYFEVWGDRQVPVTLRIRFPESMAHLPDERANQVEIVEHVFNGWCAPFESSETNPEGGAESAPENGEIPPGEPSEEVDPAEATSPAADPIPE